MDTKLRAFLDLIARAEGTETHPLTKNHGYDVIVTGDVQAIRANGKHEIGLEIFTVYVDHPFAFGRPPKIWRIGPPQETSTASGRYQLELRWWRAYSTMLGLKDFSPASQDAVALRQARERNAIDELLTGNVRAAIAACSNIWASFPDNSYGQPEESMTQLIEWYGELLDKPQTT